MDKEVARSRRSASSTSRFPTKSISPKPKHEPRPTLDKLSEPEVRVARLVTEIPIPPSSSNIQKSRSQPTIVFPRPKDFPTHSNSDATNSPKSRRPPIPEIEIIRPNQDEIVYLNIGGYRYVTSRRTLCQESNYFQALLTGKFSICHDSKGYIFIDRPGKYFEPILEYLLTDEVVVPAGMSSKAVVREAAYYSINFPLIETHQSLSFVTDDWLEERFEMRAYLKIAPVADAILAIVLQQFKQKADTSVKIQTSPFLIDDQTSVHLWLDQTEFGKEYWRFEFIDRQKKIYSKPCIVNDEYFNLLNNEENRATIIAYAKMHDLSIEIVPVNIREPGQVGKLHLTVGWKFRHVTKGGSRRGSKGSREVIRKPLQS